MALRRQKSRKQQVADLAVDYLKIKAAGKTAVIQTFGDTWTSQLFVLGDFYNVQAAVPNFAADYTAGKAKYATIPAAMAGAGRMGFARFITLSAIGGVLWATGITLLGYWLGNVPFIRNNVEALAIAIVFVSVVPIVIEAIRHRGDGGPAGSQLASL